MKQPLKKIPENNPFKSLYFGIKALNWNQGRLQHSEVPVKSADDRVSLHTYANLGENKSQINNSSLWSRWTLSREANKSRVAPR